MVTVLLVAPEDGEKPVITGAGGVWPSILLRRTVARFDGKAVKKVKPVSVSMAMVLVTKFCQGLLPTSAVFGILRAMTRVVGLMRLRAVPAPNGTTTAIFQV